MVKYLEVSDLKIANLEIALTNEITSTPGKIYPHKGPPSSIKAITNHGFTTYNLANNHMLDYGKNALLETIELLNKNKIKYFGAGKNLAEASSPLIINKNNINIGILGFSTTLPTGFAAETEKPGVNPIKIITTYRQFRNPEEYPGTPQIIDTYPVEDDLNKLLNTISELKKKTDIILIYAHWGTSMTSEVQNYQKIIAHRAIDAGANAIFGGHQHVISGIELYKSNPIIYGMGNLVFDFVPPFFNSSNTKSIVYFADITKKGIINSKFLLCNTGVNNSVSIIKNNDSEYDCLYKHMTSLCKSLGTRIKSSEDNFITINAKE